MRWRGAMRFWRNGRRGLVGGEGGWYERISFIGCGLPRVARMSGAISGDRGRPKVTRISLRSCGLHLATPPLPIWFAPSASEIFARTLRQSNPTGKSPKVCPAPEIKIFPLPRRANQMHNSARLPRREGRSRSSRRAVRCDGRKGNERRALLVRTAKSIGSDAPMQASSPEAAKAARGRWCHKEQGHQDDLV